MSRYAIKPIVREDATLLALTDTRTGAAAHIWTEVGFNLLALHLPVEVPGHGTRLVDTIMGPPTLDDLRVQPTWWGTPLLWPFPGRIPGARYTYQGTEYKFGPPDRPDDPDHGEGAGRVDMHGFVRHLPWRVTAQVADDVHASVTAVFTPDDHPGTLEGYPHQYHVSATYILDNDGLRLDFTVHNPGDAGLPFGYGAHPYIRTPLGPDGAMGDCTAQVPATLAWSHRDGHPETTTPVSGVRDLINGQPVERGAYNGIYTGIDADADGWWSGHVIDKANGTQASVHATANQPYCVVFVAPWGDGICFEPWTCPGDVFNLAANDVDGHGLIVLPPGDTWTASMRITAGPHA